MPRYDARLARLAFPTIYDSLKESVGEQLEVVGATVTPGERRARPFTLELPVHAAPGDDYGIGERMRRQVRAMLDNPAMRGQPLWFHFEVDDELSAWLMIGAAELAYGEGGLVTSDFKLTLSDAYKVGSPRTHLLARRVEAYDRRLATVPKDYLGTIFGAQFATQAATAGVYLPPGASMIRGVGGRPVTPAGYTATREGQVPLIEDPLHGETLIFDQASSYRHQGDVVIYDRRGDGQDWSMSDYAYRKTIRIDPTKVAGPISDFVASVDLTGDPDLEAHAAPDLRDLRFLDEDTTVLTHEVERAGQQLFGDGHQFWLNGPTNVCHHGKYRKLYSSYTGLRGQVGIVSLDLDTDETAFFVLNTALGVDDHTTPGIWIRPDGRIVCFYSKHTADTVIRYRVSTNPEDISAFATEVTITPGPSGAQPCYICPIYLEDTERLYLFYRGEQSRYAIWSDNLGSTWSTPVMILTNFGHRPYWQVAKNGGSRVDVVCTNEGLDFPATETPDLHHFYIEGHTLYRSNGDLICALSSAAIDQNTTSGGVDFADLTKVYDHTTNGPCFPLDLTVEPASGLPVVAYSTYPSAPTMDDQRYRYARCGEFGTWADSEIVADAGDGVVPGSTSGYTGGLSISRDDTSVIFLGRQTGTFEGDRVYHLERRVIGNTDATRAITSGGASKAIRPVCPHNRLADAPEVVFAYGRYAGLNSFSTALRYWPARTAEATVARVFLPTLDAAERTLSIYYGNPDAPDIAEDPFDESVILRESQLGRFFTGSGVSTESDFIAWGAKDLSTLTGFTMSAVFALDNYVGSGSTLDYLFSNLFSTGASVIMRVKRSTGAMEVFVTTTGGSVGGGFANPAGVNPEDGAVHYAVATYSTSTGLRLWIDGQASSSNGSFTATGAFHGTASNGALQIGTSPHAESSPANRLRGMLGDVRFADVARAPEWAQTLGHDRRDLLAVRHEEPRQ